MGRNKLNISLLNPSYFYFLSKSFKRQFPFNTEEYGTNDGMDTQCGYFELGNRLKFLRADFPLLFGNEVHLEMSNETKTLFAIGNILHTHGFPIDRTQTLNLPIEVDFQAIPKITNQRMNLEDLMNERAYEIIDSYEHIGVSYSGGVDSTGVLVALLKNLNDLSRLHVLYSDKSIEEYPDFYEILKNKIPSENLHYFYSKKITDSPFVTPSLYHIAKMAQKMHEKEGVF